MNPQGQAELPEARVVLDRCKQRWEANRPECGLVGVGPPCRKAPKLHEGLRKAESSVVTQIRTGRIRLAAFLNKARVPDFPSPTCRCGWASEIAVYVIIHYPRFIEARRGFMDPLTGQVDLRGLLSKAERAQRLAKWVLQLGILPQF